MKQFGYLFWVVLGVLFLQGCSDVQVALGDEFKLGVEETAKIKGEPIQITLLVIGREWTEEAEYAYADLMVEVDGEEKSISIYVAEKWILNEYQIYLVSADPFGDGGCKLIVTKLNED